MSDQTPDNAGVIAPPPLIYAGGMLLGLLLQALFPLRIFPRPLPRILAALPIAAGGLVALLALLEFRRRHTHVDPWAPTTAIVQSGPYRYSRNPIYLAFTLVYAGASALANSLWPLLLLPGVLLAMRRGVIEREERYLERKFGEEYLRYKRRVRRWI
jgi:protein-S-isoprenylcysteine O-methyltransferase Ste14